MKQYAGIHPSSVKVLPQKQYLKIAFLCYSQLKKRPLENVAKRHISRGCVSHVSMPGSRQISPGGGLGLGSFPRGKLWWPKSEFQSF